MLALPHSLVTYIFGTFISNRCEYSIHFRYTVHNTSIVLNRSFWSQNSGTCILSYDRQLHKTPSNQPHQLTALYAVNRLADRFQRIYNEYFLSISDSSISPFIVRNISLFFSGNAIKCVICDSNKDGLTCFARPPPAKECNPIFPHCISVSTFSQKTGEHRSTYFILTQKFLTFTYGILVCFLYN